MTDYKIIDMTNQNILGLAEDKAICVPTEGLTRGKANYLALLPQKVTLETAPAEAELDIINPEPPAPEPALITPSLEIPPMFATQEPPAPEPTLFAPAESNVPNFSEEPQVAAEEMVSLENNVEVADNNVPTAFVPLDLSVPYQPVEEAPVEQMPSDVSSLTEADKEELTAFLQEIEEVERIKQEAIKDKIIDFYCRAKLNKEETKEMIKVA